MIPYDIPFRAAMTPRFRGVGSAEITVFGRAGASVLFFDSDTLKTVETETQIDPMNRSLPKERLTFEVYDFDRSVYDRLQGLGVTGSNRVALVWKIRDEAGVDQTSNGLALTYYLNGMPTYDGEILKFSATGSVSLLSFTFTGLYDTGADVETHTLNDVMQTRSSVGDHGLAVSVRHVGLNISYDNLSGFAINDANYIATTELRDALMQVACASNRTLYTDYTGLIHLTNSTTDHPVVVSASQQTGKPSTDIVPVLRDEIISARSVDRDKQQDDEQIEVGSITGVYPAGQNVVLVEFSAPVKPGSLGRETTNATTQGISYTTASAWVTFTPTNPSEEVSIVLKGVEVPVKTTRYVKRVNENEGDNEELTCNLVSPSSAAAVADYRANYLTTMRETVRLSYRGDPSIEVMDIIRCDISGVVVPCLVIGTKFSFGTSFKGELTVKPFPRGGYAHRYNTNAIAIQAVVGDAVCGDV